eukprot:m.147507 g.147507  ORF g.147507 m.147507 type:complete len:760 (-) comp9708_c1_seq6:66-2345(-)
MAVCCAAVALACLLLCAPAHSARSLEAEYIAATEAAGRGDLARAEEGFKLIVQQAPQVVEGFTNLAVVYEIGHRWADAMRVYRRALSEHPSSVAVPTNMCVTLLRLIQEGNTGAVQTEAANVREICRRAKELNPENPSAHSTLGDMHTLLVEWDDAVAAYKEAIRLYRKAESTGKLASMSWSKTFQLSRTYSNLANSYSRAGHVPDAVEAATTALALHPRDAHSMALLGTIRTTGRKFDFQTRVIKHRAAILQARGVTVKDASCPKGGPWRVAFTWPEAASDAIHVEVINDATRNTLYGLNRSYVPDNARLRWTTPEGLTPYPTIYRERTLYFINATAVHIGGASGVIHRNCTLYAGSHGEDARLHEAGTFGTPVDRVQHIKGAVVSLLSQNLKNYYHFMCECVPRLLLTLQFMESRADVAAALRKALWLVPDLPYVRDILEILDLSIKTHTYSGLPRIKADRLYMVDWHADELDAALREAGVPPGGTADPDDDALWQYESLPDYAALPAIDDQRTLAHDPWSQFYPPRAGLVLMREKVRAAIGADARPASDWLVVVLSRSDAMSGSFGIRVLPNEAVLIAALERMVGPDRVYQFRGKDLPMRKQLEYFARAVVVVAPHGAGLANTVACKRNTTLIMYPMRPHVDNTFGHMAAALGLEMWIAPDITSYYYGSYTLLTPASANNVLRAVATSLEEKGLPIVEQVVLDDAPFNTWLRKHKNDALVKAAEVNNKKGKAKAEQGKPKNAKKKKSKATRTTDEL